MLKAGIWAKAVMEGGPGEGPATSGNVQRKCTLVRA